MTTVFGVTMVRDEDDIVGQTVGHMTSQVDHVIVADNGSVDGTRGILDQLPITVEDDPDIGYYQSDKISRLAESARQQGADWIVPFDADELWFAGPRTVKEVLSELPEQCNVAEAVLYDHVATVNDPPGPPTYRIAWRRKKPLGLPKVACRATPGLTIAQGNHGCSFPAGTTTIIAKGILEIRHFPYRSENQFLRKAKNGAQAYAATDLPKDVGAHWRQYGQLLETQGEEAVKDWFRLHFLSVNPEQDRSLVCDPAPL